MKTQESPEQLKPQEKLETLEIEKLEREAEKCQNPEEARKLFLDAAEEYLKESKRNPARQKELMQKALGAYQKSKKTRTRAVSKAKEACTGKNFQSIAGLSGLKEEISIKIIGPLKMPELFKHFSKSIGGGVLMYGPPGCGKSLMAEAAAGEAGLPFFNVKASDIKSKYVGETEQNIAMLFEEARKQQPCIIFFDEFESLGGDRFLASESEKSFVSQILTEMDGVGTKDQQILLLAATNEPWSVDSALLREGRFGASIFVPPPNLESRKKILNLNLGRRPLDKSINLEAIAELTEHYSGADLKGVCEAAVESAIRDCIKNGIRRDITVDDLFHALNKRKPSIARWFKKACAIIKKNKMEDQFEPLMEYAEKSAYTVFI